MMKPIPKIYIQKNKKRFLYEAKLCVEIDKNMWQIINVSCCFSFVSFFCFCFIQRSNGCFIIGTTFKVATTSVP